MIGMQSVVLKAFVRVTRIKTYVLATGILTFATIGVLRCITQAMIYGPCSSLAFLALQCGSLAFRWHR